jgi:hypothetical protein
MRTQKWLALGFCLFSACGGARTAPPAQAPSPTSAESARASSTEKSAAQPGYAPPASPPAADYAAPPPPAASPVAPSAGAPEPQERAEAPATTDARSRYARANVQLSEARRQIEIATSQRDCANACRALDSMERAAAQLCELARSSDERRTCKSAEDQVGAARDRVHTACGDCPKKTK